MGGSRGYKNILSAHGTMSKDRIIPFRALLLAMETRVTRGKTRRPRIHEPLTLLYPRDPPSPSFN